MGALMLDEARSVALQSPEREAGLDRKGDGRGAPIGVSRPTLDGRRIALFSGNYNYVRDGANQALNRLVGRLEELGATVRVYSPVTSTPAFPPTGTLVPVPSVRLPGRGEYRLALGLSAATRDDIATFNPHLVHLSAPDWLGTKAQTFARDDLRIPVVASLHTRFERYLDHYGMGFLRRLMVAHLDRFYGRCDRVLVPNAPILEELAPKLGKDRLRIWGRGVDRDLFSPGRRSEAWRASLGLAPTDVAILFFGRLVLEKGTRAFAEMMIDLQKTIPNARALVVGDGPARTEMEQMLPNAIFTGQLTGNALATAIASADVMVNPSLSEAFGNVNLEAMASGLAVVAADCDSARNLMVHGESGWLCQSPPGSDWSKEVSELLKSGRLPNLGSAAAKVASTYEWTSILDAVAETYLDLLTSNTETSGKVL